MSLACMHVTSHLCLLVGMDVVPGRSRCATPHALFRMLCITVKKLGLEVCADNRPFSRAHALERADFWSLKSQAAPDLSSKLKA